MSPHDHGGRRPLIAADFANKKADVGAKLRVASAISEWQRILDDEYDCRKEEARVRISELRMVLAQFPKWMRP